MHTLCPFVTSLVDLRVIHEVAGSERPSRVSLSQGSPFGSPDLLLICQWTPRLLLLLALRTGFLRTRCANICLRPCRHFFWDVPRSGIAGSYGNFSYFSEETSPCFLQQLPRCAFPAAVREDPSFSTSLLTLDNSAMFALRL